MDIKRLLIHLDHSSGCRNRLEAAFQLARDHDASISGLFVVPDYIVPAYVEAQISVDLIGEISEKARARARDAVTRYHDLARDAGVTLQAQVVEGQVIPLLREHSKCCDLLLLGQDHPEDPDNASYGLADALLFEGACACLVVPHSDPVTPLGKKVLLTWNASREAARALRESLPLLQQADSVVLLSSAASGGEALDGELAQYLAAHGIKISVSRSSDPNTAPSAAIVDEAEAIDADLIVMGAYGHARLREIILGGVTRDLLKHAPAPLLLAH